MLAFATGTPLVPMQATVQPQPQNDLASLLGGPMPASQPQTQVRIFILKR